MNYECEEMQNENKLRMKNSECRIDVIDLTF